MTIRLFLIIAVPFILFQLVLFISKAQPVPANITIDTQKAVGTVNFNWKALAQGGEKSGVRMLEPAIPHIAKINPKYIRLDHIYDYYHVVSRNAKGELMFDWTALDQTVCDIYHTNSKPFFSLGYMPPSIAKDGSVISPPKDWNEWAYVVKTTIEHYSNKNARLCGNVTGDWFNNIYYEVWNEPDHESFGKWSIHGGEKDYRTLYYYAATGASRAQNVYPYYLGGPATTALYENWITKFLDFVSENNLKLDFLSWHHYTKNPSEYALDATRLNNWLSNPRYERYQNLQTIISEWGYDSQPNNPYADSNIGAAYTVESIKYMMDQNVRYAFLFEVIDGDFPSWGILTQTGAPKPRFNVLQMLDTLDWRRLSVEGEGSFVHAIATSGTQGKISVVLVNYDPDSKNTEAVPVRFLNLPSGQYTLTIQNLIEKTPTVSTVTIDATGQLHRSIIMPANNVVSIVLEPL